MADKTRSNARKVGGSQRPGNAKPGGATAKGGNAAAKSGQAPVRAGAPRTASVREQQKALRAIQKRKNARRQAMFRIGIPVLVIVLIVAVGIIVKVAVGNKTSKGAASTPASAATVAGVTGVSLTNYNAVGVGSIANPPIKIGGVAPLTSGGLPQIVYLGAEYCPYCAAERWSIVAALSRFGTWTNLGQTTSSSTDVDPSTPTLSFHGATYTSKYLTFTGVEETTNQSDPNSPLGYKVLDTPTPEQEALVKKFDAPPYVASGSAGSIPFVDIGNQYIISGASYDGSVLKGLSHDQIAQAMSDPTSSVAKGIVGTANVVTAAVCAITNGQPASVCTSPGVVAGKAKLPTAVKG